MNGPIGRRRDLQSTVGAALATGARNSGGFEADDEGRTESMKSFRVAAVAWDLPASPERNLEHCADWIARAAQAGAALVCFPELWIPGYVTTPEIWTAAEPVPGPSTEKLAELARKAGLIVAAGIAEKDRDIVYDTYVFVGPDGYLGKSRKIHIPPAEVGYWRGGGVAPVIDIGLAKVGVNVCFDNWLRSRRVWLPCKALRCSLRCMSGPSGMGQ